MNPFNPRSWLGWARELGQFAALRRSARGGFIVPPGPPGTAQIPLPSRVWTSKSHPWWVLLAAMLHQLRPECMLELGSGRSTIYLSEYATKCDKILVAADENPAWVAAGNMIANLGGLRTDCIHHVAIRERDGYYDMDRVRGLLPCSPDFLYIDGPLGTRDGLLSDPYMRELCAGARIVILDDIQWEPIHRQMQALTELGMHRTSTIIEYDIPEDTLRALAVMVSEELQPHIDALVQCLGIETSEFPVSRCIPRGRVPT
ncbi:MAG: hypothetical protein KDG50_16085 [Chromatiales bacterium]|nr:hypothetical protein [Chromatiales bacterium]